MPEFFSSSLYREVRDPAFFRVLAGRNAPTYVDVLDALERECADRPDGMSREETVELVTEVLDKHPALQPEEDSAAEFEQLPIRDKARQVVEHLVRCRWLEEPPRRDWRRRIFFDAHGATLMGALRKIARPDAAVFTDKLLAVCAALANDRELAQNPWQTVVDCVDRTNQGLNELRGMQKSVQRFTRRQLEEKTLKGNLEVVFDDYSKEVAQSCYAELVRARLPSRLPEAVKRIQDRLLDDPGMLAAMQTECLRRREGMSAETARATVVRTLDDLSHLLEMVLPMADEIDRRTADFTRRSLSRFRYLQEVTGERRGEVRAFFEQVNRLHAGRKFSGAWDMPPLPSFRVPEARIPYGRDSLHVPSVRHAPPEQEAMEDELSDADRKAGMADMERALRESLSVRRANEFVGTLPGGRGTTLTSAEIAFAEGEKGADLLALLLHAESSEARYRIEAARNDETVTEPEFDPFPGGKVERFHLIKK